MAKCETCGNDYDKAFQVTMKGTSHTFDSFECAIQALAPTCPSCGTHIVGHGVEKDDTIFCCAHCARKKVLPNCAIVFEAQLPTPSSLSKKRDDDWHTVVASPEGDLRNRACHVALVSAANAR